jgi:FkbM family methyltransferase
MDDSFNKELTVSRLKRCRHGTMMYLATDQGIGRALDHYGEFAESENRVMTNLLKPGEVALDVGANVGTVTLALARRVGAQGRIFAFEPQRIVFQHLCTNIVLNQLFNVDARWAAVGERAGTALIPAVDPRTQAPFGSVKVSSTGKGDPVPMVTIDSLALPRCHLIKIDVEGMEWQVLAGAAHTIGQHRPLLYFEAKTGPVTESCLSWLIENNYDLYWHFAFFYEAENFAGERENIFPGVGDINALAVPHERGLRVNLPPVSAPNADWKSEYTSWFENRQRQQSVS